MKVKVGDERDCVLLGPEEIQIYASLPLLVEVVVKRLECGRNCIWFFHKLNFTFPC